MQSDAGIRAEPASAAPCPAAFDDMASAYDASFTHSSVGMALREIVWMHVERVFRPPQCLLELGCGTGEDALRFASAGFHVTATDVSQRMIDVARQKASRTTSQSPVEFRCVPMEAVGTTFHDRRFEGVFSNFGAVNCVTDLRALASNVAGVLAPGAPLMWVVMGRYVPWEWLWFLLHGKPRKALRRLHPQGARWRDLTICYPTPPRLSTLLEPHFEVTRVAPLGCVLPPSYAANWLNRSPRMLTTLARFERYAQRWPALATWADHYIIEAVRRPTAHL